MNTQSKTKIPAKAASDMLACVGLMSCGGDSLLIERELSANSSNPVIRTVKGNIEYTFCLTNEAGKPANTFREREIFHFFMAVENPDAERPVMFRVDFLMKGIHTFRIVSQNETFELRNRVVPCSEEMKVHQLYRYDEFCRVELAIPCWGEAWGNARYCIATPHRPHWPAGLLPGIFHRIRVLRAGHPARRKFRLRGKKTFPCRLKSISKLNDMNLDMAMLNIQRSNIISGFSEKSTLEEKKSSHEEMK